MKCFLKWVFNSLTTVGYLLVVFFRIWIPSLVCISTSAWSYVPLETWAKASLTFLLWVHQLRPLISELSMVRALQPANSPPDWTLPTDLVMVPLYKGRGVVSAPICTKKVSSQCQLSQGRCYVHGVMITACLEYACPPPPIPPLC